jgi:hypothetical protein
MLMNNWRQLILRAPLLEDFYVAFCETTSLPVEAIKEPLEISQTRDQQFELQIYWQ